MRADISAHGTSLRVRLRKHASSIKAASNLDVDHFVYRHLVLDDIWIPLGENILIETFRPLWNVAIDGFGINAPGKGRLNQKKSPWDVLHAGRSYTASLTGGGADLAQIQGRVDDHFTGRALRPLPVALQATPRDGDQEESADES